MRLAVVMEPRTSILLVSWYIVSASAQYGYDMPDPFLQAKNGRGFRAYLPDSCGIENFEFQALTNKSNSEEDWLGGNVTKPENGQWIYDAPDISLTKGDRLRYRANIKHRGKEYRHPDAEWVVDDLVDDYDPPPVDRRQQCNDRRRPPNNDSREDFPPNPYPTKPGYKSHCPWADVPRPGDSREVVLEKQLVGLQCEMNSFMERSARLQFQLTQELTDLKKLNYAAVARMQRLETLIRNMPRQYPAAPSYPFI